MKWSRILKRQGWTLPENGIEPDPFEMLSRMADPKEGSVARVSYGTKTAYGDVLVNVSIECPQNEPCINLAGEIAFRKAVELANDGASQINAAGIQPPPDPED